MNQQAVNEMEKQRAAARAENDYTRRNCLPETAYAGAIMGKPVEVEREIPLQVERLGHIVMCASDAVEALRHRLSPVLRDEPQEKTGGKVEPLRGTNLGRTLAEMTASVQNLTDVIGGILRSLEL